MAKEDDLTRRANNETVWAAADRERGILETLIRLLLGMRSRTRSGQDLQALGTAIRFMEEALDGNEPDYQAELTIGYRTEDWSEGRWMRLSVTEWGIDLDEIRTFQGPAGNDTESDRHASLSPGETWKESGVARWIAGLNEVMANERVTFDGTLNE